MIKKISPILKNANKILKKCYSDIDKKCHQYHGKVVEIDKCGPVLKITPKIKRAPGYLKIITYSFKKSPR